MKNKINTKPIIIYETCINCGQKFWPVESTQTVCDKCQINPLLLRDKDDPDYWDLLDNFEEAQQ